MSSLAFDSLRFARRLKEAGVPEIQAEAQAELMAETFGFYVDNLVTKDYLDARFSELEARFDASFSEHDARLEARFSDQDVRLENRFSDQDLRLEARFAKQDLYIEQRLSGLDVKLNVMAAILTVIAASVVPLAISTFFGG
ncbi:hypothetical protein [Congregibacter sp.]|uniref:hypothetical protein n=1 Tax=Congregibacter sp. TaxID=2744308 RepID=UPI003F6D3700